MNEVFSSFLSEGSLIDGLWGVLKILYLVGLTTYVVFAVVVVKQIGQMTKTVHGLMDNHLKSLGYVHLVVAIGVFLIALLIL